LDTNVIVSGVLYRGNESKLLHQMIAGRFTNVTSEEMIKELANVLERPKFDMRRDMIDWILNIIEVFSEDVDDGRIRQVGNDIRELEIRIPGISRSSSVRPLGNVNTYQLGTQNSWSWVGLWAAGS
jgi:putative PIN family toxin of toxin-antitoxin system